MKTKIIDISKYQGLINWQRVKASGVDGAYIRTFDTVGLLVDPTFDYNWREAISAGMLVGAYIPFYFWMDVNKTVDLMFNTIDLYNRGGWWMGHLPIAIDIEPSGVYKSVEYQWGKLQELIAAIEKKCLVSPIIYTSRYTWNQFVNPNNNLKFNKLPSLWLANYIFDYERVGKNVTTWEKLAPYLDTFKPAIPNNWTDVSYDIWQVAGDDGHVEGVDTACDMDIWRGTYAELVQWGIDHKVKEIDTVPGERGEVSKFEKVNELFWKGDIGGAINALFNLSDKKLPTDVKPLPTNQQVINAFYNVYGGESYFNKLVEVLGSDNVNAMIENRESMFLAIDLLPQEVKDNIS